MFSDDDDPDWRNRLIWGDKRYVLPALLPEFAGKVDLIYIDPPFDTGADFSFTTTIPDTDTSFVKEPSVIEQKAYRDTWGKGLDSYLKWFYDSAVVLRDLLSDTGTLYVHLDYHVGHYAKCLLDEVFGIDNFQSEITWKRTSARSDATTWASIHDCVFVYSKTKTYTWNKTVVQEHDQAYLDSKYRNSDERGTYMLDNLTAAGLRNGDSGKPWRSADPSRHGGHWALHRETLHSLVSKEQASALTTQEKLDILDANGYIYWPTRSKAGGTGVPRFKRYLNAGVALQDLILDIPPVNSQADERTAYATQKPEALLDRIIRVSSNVGDLVLDSFCGSGTTAAVAEKLNRRWITCDLGRFAIHTARKRLLSIPNVKPFIVQNLGKYERQHWQAAEFGDSAEARLEAYRRFVLNLYNARPISGYIWLHGVKAGRMVHIGSVDAPVSVGDVTQIVTEFRRAMGAGTDAPTENGVDVLGWDFAFEVNEVSKQQAALANIALNFKRIPREVLEKKAVDQGDIRFFELAALAVEVQAAGKSVTVRLTDFTIPVDDVPSDIQKAIAHWEQWIDYWAVDWDNRSDTFHNMAQTFRTRKDKGLQKQLAHQYSEPGEYRIVVKVIDILGNDTTKTLTVKV